MVVAYQCEVSWDLLDGSGTSNFISGAPYSGYFGTCVLGCTDPNAPNYDPTADIDDGSCAYGPCFATAPTHEDFGAGIFTFWILHSYSVGNLCYNW